MPPPSIQRSIIARIASAATGTLAVSCLLAVALLPHSVNAQTNSSEVETAPVTHLDVGSFHTVVIINDLGKNVVKSWGSNGKGQLGLNDTKDRGDNDGPIGDALPPTELGTGRYAVQVAAGLRHSCAILDDGSVKCWGYNAKGQLGVGSISPVGDSFVNNQGEMGDNLRVTNLGAGLKAEKIAAGGWHTCALLDNEELKCWGYNQWGELGLEDNDNRGDMAGQMGDMLLPVDFGTAKVEEIALGDWHSCVILDTGEVACFGKNYAGQLGIGRKELRGDEQGEMGFSVQKVDFHGRRATKITAGEEHNCAILEDNSLICWGLGSYGQLGQGNSLDIGDDPNEIGNLPPIDLGTGRFAIDVSAGGNHTCALLDDMSLKCWGDNSYGELGLGDTEPRGDDPFEMGDNLPAVNIGLGRVPHSMSLGYYHSCALVDPVWEDSSVVCWGANFHGQLGLALTEDENIGDEPGEMGDNLPFANLGGQFKDNEKSLTDEVWFIVVVSLAGAVVLCCLVACIVRSHGDTGSGKMLPKSTSMA